MQTKRKLTYQIAVSAFLILGTGIVLLASIIPDIRTFSEYSVHFMLGMLAISMLALSFNKKTILFTGLICTASLALFLKNASNSELKLAEVNHEVRLNVAHINLGNILYDFEATRNKLLQENIEVISLQELTPDWHMILKDILSVQYPYQKSEVRIDPYGMAIYSKYPFSSVTVEESQNIPFIKCEVEKQGTRFDLISSYLHPAINKIGVETAGAQLQDIAVEINTCHNPTIAMGEFNMVYWASEIMEFRNKTQLKNSRRDISESNLRVPYDHIFYSDQLECTVFKELKDSSKNYIGIMGTYQKTDSETSSDTFRKLSMR